MKLDPVKIVKCLKCGADVTVNARYPIDNVYSCVNCPEKMTKISVT